MVRLTPNEHRLEMLRMLARRQHDKISNLAFELGVSEITIMRVIHTLSLYYPIYTTQGKGGGVHIVDNFRFGMKYLNDTQFEALAKVISKIGKEDAKIVYYC